MAKPGGPVPIKRPGDQKTAYTPPGFTSDAETRIAAALESIAASLEKLANPLVTLYQPAEYPDS
jgi:hypothetical protein